MHKDYQDIVSLLRCPDCKNSCIYAEGLIGCGYCTRLFGAYGKIMKMLPINSQPLPEMYYDPEYLKLISIYDKVLRYHYIEDNIVKRFNDWQHTSVKKFFGKNIKDMNSFYLDVGCGVGTYWIENNLQNLICVDINEEALELMSNIYPYVPLIQADICNLPFANDSQDGIFAIGVLEHIYYLERALDELKRILKPKGKLIVSIPTEGGILFKLCRKITTDRYFKHKYDINHAHVIKITHCNTAKKIIRNLLQSFRPLKTQFRPFMVPLIDINLFFNGIFCKKQ